ncbi:MAG: hypothetical protein M8357_10885 [Desulfobulbaceae bacterium]|nr:hypothetical protein [Desulfobulbaceae bacterium]
MKRIMIYMVAMTISMLMVASANAVSVGVTAAGAQVTIEAAGIDGADPLVFNPSPQVQMSVISRASGFSLNGVHASALETAGGQAYGMADDTNKVFWISVQAENSTLVAVTTSSSDEFWTKQADYNPMN